MPKLSVIIPVYNEEQFINRVIDRALSVPLPAPVDRELVIVDDGSTDGTKTVLAAYRGRPGIRVLWQRHRGKTAALLAGIAAVAGDLVLIQDADFEYDPKYYPVLLAPVLEGRAAVVYGSRFKGSIQGMSFINRAANAASNAALRFLYGVGITDVNTGFKLFRKEIIQSIPIVSEGFSFETEVTVKLIHRGVSIVEVPIDYVARHRKEGKKIDWPGALKMFWQIIRYRMQK